MFSRLSAVLFLGIVSNSFLLEAATFHSLGSNTQSSLISADGSTVLGSFRITQVGQPRQFLWSRDSGITPLQIPSGLDQWEMEDISGDGTVLVGTQFRQGVGFDAIRWTNANGTEVLGPVPAGFDELSSSRAITNDGLSYVASAFRESNQTHVPHQWNGSDFNALSTLGGGNASVTYGSGDGSVLVGQSSPFAFSTRPVRWVNGAIDELPSLVVNATTKVRGVSASGNMIIGESKLNSEPNAVPIVWKGSQVSALPNLPGFTAGIANATNHDGSIIVGRITETGVRHVGAVWTEVNGLRTIDDYLSRHAPDLSNKLEGWKLQTIDSVSDDGLVLAGTGMSPSGEFSGWVADTRQYVHLDWGEDDADGKMPIKILSIDTFALSFSIESQLFGELLDYSDSEDGYKDRVVTEVQRIFTESGVRSVVVTREKLSSEAAVRVYMTEDENTNTLGTGVGGPVDRLNTRPNDEAVVFDFNSVEGVSTVIAHEVGHQFGLRHIDPEFSRGGDGDLVVMDYGKIGGPSLFHNRAERIREPSNLNLFTDTKHNPMYHLRKFVDKASDEVLDSEELVGSSDWDNEESIIISFPLIEYGFTFFMRDSDIKQLFNFTILTGGESSFEAPEVLLSRESILISELEELVFELMQQGIPIGVFASSIPGGPLDIVMLDSAPIGGIAESFLFPVLQGESSFQFYREANNAQGFEVLADVTLTSSIVPEPSGLVIAFLFGCILIMHSRVLHCTRNSTTKS